MFVFFNYSCLPNGNVRINVVDSVANEWKCFIDSKELWKYNLVLSGFLGCLLLCVTNTVERTSRQLDKMEGFYRQKGTWKKSRSLRLSLGHGRVCRVMTSLLLTRKVQADWAKVHSRVRLGTNSRAGLAQVAPFRGLFSLSLFFLTTGKESSRSPQCIHIPGRDLGKQVFW